MQPHQLSKMENNTLAKHAIIRGIGLPISLKASIEICNMLRHKQTARAKLMLEQVISKRQPVPFKVFKKETPHRMGKIAEGRYPVKASKEILQLVKGVEANAHNIGLSFPLVISEIKADKGPQQFHHGRKRRVRYKRTHLTIKVQALAEKPKELKAVKERKR